MPLSKEAKRKYDKIWLKKRKAEFFDNKVCAKCGSKNNLELDHINPETKITHRVWSWAKERREEELNKCQALCKDCHKQKTLNQLRKIGPENTEWCTNCKQFKLVEKFYRNKNTWNGLTSTCKHCHDFERNQRLGRSLENIRR